MRTKFLFYITCIGLLITASCKREDFLDRFPLDGISEPTFFKNENDLKLYCNRFYASLPVQGAFDDENSDNMVPRNVNSFLAGTYIVPVTDGSWNWTNERGVNYFLQRYQRAAVSDDVKSKYAGEIRFFRAYFYWRKVVRYGDVPWLSKDLNEKSPELYAPRDPHKKVMDSVLADLDFAIANLKDPANSDKDRINKDIALALKARVCLWEGTFRKYHALGDEGKYLQEAANAAGALITSQHYDVYTTGNPSKDYYNLFLQEELSGNKEAIMPKRYLKDVLMHNLTRQMNDRWPSFSKDFVRSFLCRDGLPIALSPLYKGDDSLDAERINRDPRFIQIIATRGYVNTNNTDGSKDTITLPRLSSSTTGYGLIKFKSPDPAQNNANQSTLDLFIFRYAETLLIYAEAKAEMGQADQDVINKTINKLRDRVGMQRMDITTLVKDPNSPFPALTVLLDEIRRERRVELAGDGMRMDDLLRWRAGKLIENAETILGMKLHPNVKAQYPPSQVNNIVLDANGYIRTYTNIISRVWNDKMYRYPLPTQETTLNPALLPQNPGW